jgi:hypothetical protein
VVVGTGAVVSLDAAVVEGVVVLSEADCTGAPGVCNDGNPCTDDACVAGVCQNTANTAPCEDGEFCTVGDTCAAGVCVAGQRVELSCLDEPQALCAVYGEPGDRVSCPVRLVHESGLTPVVHALELALSYPPSALGVSRLWDDDVCIAPGLCGPADVPPFALSSGHSMTLGPASATSWSGSGEMLAVHLGDPATPLTTATLLPGGGPGPGAELWWIEVELLSAVPIEAPVVLTIEQVGASHVTPVGAVIELALDLVDGLLVAMQPPP